jgi:hypothetical protein
MALLQYIRQLTIVIKTLTPDRRASNKASPHASMSTWELVNYPGVLSVIVIYAYTMLLALAYTAGRLPTPHIFLDLTNTPQWPLFSGSRKPN